MSPYSKQIYQCAEHVMARVLISLCMIFWVAAASFAQGSITIDLGPKKDVAQLYSFPNNCGAVVCYLNQTFEQIIEKYLRASLERDGYDATTVKVTIADAVNDPDQRVSVQLNGAGANAYAALLPKYLEAGKRGIEGAGKIKRFIPDPDDLVPDICRLLRELDRKVPEGWRYSWRFFMPHGVAMANHYTVQLLHFPPSNVLMETQDYLAASTTKRWAQLLIENGAKLDEVDRFQNIIDIAPIAAPHEDGCKLESTYSHFNDYNIALLELWLPQAGPAASKPMVAFGSKVRKWLKKTFNLKQKLIVPTLTTVALPSGLQAPTLIANHPSKIWAVKDNAKEKCLDDCNTQGKQIFKKVMRIMANDLIAACWQVDMVKNQEAKPKDALASCEKRWTNRDTRMCELSYMQVWNKPEEKAKKLCSGVKWDLVGGAVSP